MVATRKPKLRAASARWLHEIDCYIRQYDLRGEWLHHAASDTLDGGATRDELDDLIRRGFLRVVRYSRERIEEECGTAQCGSSWTVELTDKAVRLFWPERVSVVQTGGTA